MKFIYEPQGKAREYCKLALNIYKGCSHGCFYCFAPDTLRYSNKGEYFSNNVPRYLVLEAVKREAPQHTGKHILMSFISDPYQPVEEFHKITLQVLQVFKENGVIPVILTKGGLVKRDLNLLSEFDEAWLGMTLTYDTERASLENEPQAALPEVRLEILQKAKYLGIKTWVSLEPVINPDTSLNFIKTTKDFIDIYKVGKWNYNEKSREIDWRKFLNNAVYLLEKQGSVYYIKEDLFRYGLNEDFFKANKIELHKYELPF